MEDFTDCVSINHLKITCEFSDQANSLMVYKEWDDGSNFEFLGSLKSIVEWEKVKESLQLLSVNR